MTEKLAILGGTPVRRAKTWPHWPRAANKTLGRLNDVLESNRWTVRSRYRGRPTFDRIFCTELARQFGAKFSVAGPSGSAAILLALEALNLRPGHEVIVPAVTWIAPIISVLDANLVPVFADIDPTTYCLSPDAAAAAVTSRTACILPVHYHCRMADMDGLKRVAAKNKLALVEDCAQAHGAIWRDRHAGTIGDIGAFSMHNDKLLTCGEGGALLTNRRDLYERLQTLRLDGYSWTGEPTVTPEGTYEMPHPGRVMGRSCCMSEFQAAVLVDQLAALSRLGRLREKNAMYLEAGLAELGGLWPLRRAKQLTRAAYYEFAIRFEPDAFAGRSVDTLCAALAAELGFDVFSEAEPVYRHALYQPQTRRRYAISREFLRRIAPQRWHLPAAEEASRRLITFLHPPLMGTQGDMDDIVTAFSKVQRQASKLPNPN